MYGVALGAIGGSFVPILGTFVGVLVGVANGVALGFLLLPFAVTRDIKPLTRAGFDAAWPVAGVSAFLGFSWLMLVSPIKFDVAKMLSTSSVYRTAMLIWGASTAAFLYGGLRHYLRTPRYTWPDVVRADCPWCGYDVRALRDPVCPECGQAVTATRAEASTDRLR